MGRIPNWHEMSDTDKAKATRLVSARNKKRLQAIAMTPDNMKGNMIDNVKNPGEDSEVEMENDPMKGSGSGSTSGIKTTLLTIEEN